jgi:hypothetical protein
VFEAGLNEQGGVAALAGDGKSRNLPRAWRPEKLGASAGRGESVAKNVRPLRSMFLLGRQTAGSSYRPSVGVAEHHAGAAQGIQVRRPDVRIAERGDGIGALVAR